MIRNSKTPGILIVLILICRIALAQSFKNKLVIKSDSVQVEKWIEIGYQNAQTDTIIALESYRKALNLSRKLNHFLLIHRCLNELGNLYIDTDVLDKAKAYHLESLKYALLTGRHDRIGISFNNLGNIEYKKHHSEAALQYYQKGLHQFEIIKDTARYVNICSNLANLFSTNGQSRQAIEFGLAAIRFLPKNADPCQRLLAYYQLGTPYNRLQQQVKEKWVLDKCLEFTPTCSSPNQKQAVYEWAGYYFFKNDSLAIAKVYTDSCLYYAEKLEDKSGYTVGCLQKGLILAEEKKWKEAYFWLNKGTPALASETDWMILKSGHWGLAMAANFRKDYKVAFGHLMKYMQYFDSTHNQTVAAQLTEMETRFQNQNKQNEIVQLKKEKEIQSLTIEKRNAWLIASLVGLGLFLLVGMLFWRNSKQKQEIQRKEIDNLKKEKQLEALSGIIKGEENERNRMAQDLHDGLGSLLSGVKLSLTSMKGGAMLSESQTELFGHSLQQLDGAITEMRRVAHNLMPTILMENGLVAALNSFTESLNETGQIKVHFEHFDLNERLNREKEIVAYRMIQEAVNNALKHAAAKQIIIQIRKVENQIQIEVEDDGNGFDPTKITMAKAGGLQNLKNRAEFLKGTFEVRSEPGKGSTIVITFPFM